MKVLACVAAVIASAVATSGCASSHAAQHQASTNAIQLHESGYDQLSPKLQDFIRSTIRDSPDGHVTEIDVYGPGTRAALVKASSGDIVYPTGREATEPFYLIVLHGHFVCTGCSGPAGSKPPTGTIETHVWSPAAGSLDFGIQNSLPPAVSLLNRLAVIQLS
jgi:outer membrane murein-binding lipoprotein Lpp